MVLVVNEPYDDSEHVEDSHPERPARTAVVRSAIDDLHLESDLIVAPTRVASRAELLRVHDASYLDELGAFCYGGGGDLDADTYATFNSWSIAQNAAGGGLAVIDELRRRDGGIGFVVTRPPGHHALANRAMGFCLLNNVAIAAAALTAVGERVLVIDWDVHHGNGTQQIFWNSPDVLYVSTHQWPLYPGSGSAEDVGGWNAIDRTINIPLPSGTTGDVLLRSLEEIAAPVIDEFQPTWVLVSAGFDAHRDDPLADLALTGGDFAQLALLAASFAPRPGRLALFLEGGYDLNALRSSVASSLGAVLGVTYDGESRSVGGPGAELVDQVQHQRLESIESLRLIAAKEEQP